MKRKYISPETVMISLSSKEVIFTSIDGDQPDEEDPGFGLISMGMYWRNK